MTTLLNTVDYVLNFVKLNNLSKTDRRVAMRATTLDSRLTSVFDLAVVVEDAIKAVYAGQVFHTANSDAYDGNGDPVPSSCRAMQKRQEVKAEIALG